jgi:hypothetical protein
MHTDTHYVVRAPGLGLGDSFAVESGFKQGAFMSPMLSNLYMDCAIRDVMSVIKDVGVRFRYTIDGALRETDSQTVGEEELLWILLYADDIVFISETLVSFNKW